MKVQITLKNGVQLDVEATDMTQTRNRLTGELTELEWTRIDGRPGLFMIALAEVVAIVTLAGDDEPALT